MRHIIRRCLPASSILLLLSNTALAQPQWTRQSSGTNQTLWGVWGGSGSSVVAVGNVGTIHLSFGSQWSPFESNTTGDLCDVWGNVGNDIYAVGPGGLILHFDGAQWSEMQNPLSTDLFGVHTRAFDDAWAVGADGTILRYNGTVWSPVDAGVSAGLYGTWIESPGVVWVVGAVGTVLRYDGVWGETQQGVESLSDIFGFTPDDIWAVGDDATAIHYDGTAWTSFTVSGSADRTAGAGPHLFAVWGSGSADVFAAGQSGAIFHFDGRTWSAMDSPTVNSLHNVWGSGADNVYAVGAAGEIIHYGADGPVPVLITRFVASARADGNVRVVWDMVADEQIVELRVLREALDAPSGTKVVATLLPAAREWIDTHVRAGESYRFTLVAVGAVSGEVRSIPAAVTVPAGHTTLRQNFPNPFNPATTIRFEISHAGHTTVDVFSVDGRRVRTLVDGELGAGMHSVEWDGRDGRGADVASGVYLYRLRTGNSAISRRMVLGK